MQERLPPEPIPAPPPLKVGVLRSLLRLCAILVIAFALHQIFVWAEGWITQNRYERTVPGLVLALLVIYAVMIAIPFVPGVEIGLGVLAISGPDMAPFVWLATTAGLVLSYMVGCKVPYRWLHRVLLDLHLTRACRMLARFESLSLAERTAWITSLLPVRGLGWLVQYRYVNLAILINIPGNSVIGGGGGIAFISGLSGMFRPLPAALTIALATAPVPLAIWLFGWQIPWN